MRIQFGGSSLKTILPNQAAIRDVKERAKAAPKKVARNFPSFAARESIKS